MDTFKKVIDLNLKFNYGFMLIFQNKLSKSKGSIIIIGSEQVIIL